ncbi:MAG: EAL domain-containing protein [Thermotogae bacterium]|nr:EAL domain-containing protein [Thermotogota bacterium]
MKKNNSLKFKLIIILILGFIIPYFIGTQIIKSTIEKDIYDNYTENYIQILKDLTTHIDNFVIDTSRNIIDTLSVSDIIINSKGNLNSYTDISGGLPEMNDYETRIFNLFKNIAENFDNITLIGLGTENGEYIEYPLFRPENSYDPRTREWYRKALESDSLIITNPYKTKVTGELVITFSKSVKHADDKIGVIGCSVSLDNILKTINESQIDGYINIISPEGLFINSPGNNEWILKSVSEIPPDTFSDIEKYNGYSFEDNKNFPDKILTAYISEYNGWQYVSVTDKSEVRIQTDKILKLINTIFISTFIVVLILIIIISDKLAGPILIIASKIEEMANFNFFSYKNENLKKYSVRKDEIGRIASAMTLFQDNFNELKNNLTLVNTEIKNVDIKQKNIQKIELKENNPFIFITESINNLLEKVYNYTEKIKLFNYEMAKKNEQLTISEEALREQLKEIELQKDYINFLAEHDPLTELPNRRIFYTKLKNSIDSGKRGAVLLLDIDNFKSLNDTMGHVFGDRVLKIISERLIELSKKEIFVSRFGGDEFLILCENHGKEETDLFIKKLFKTLNGKITVDNAEFSIEFSLGISFFPEDSLDITELIMYCDMAMYNVKSDRKNNFFYFDKKLSESLALKQNTKELLKNSIENDGFKILYQPQIDISTGTIKCFESLLRIRGNSISPSVFIPIAEEDKTILQIGRIVTEKVIIQLKSWKDNGFDLKPISINFSPLQIRDTGYLDFLISTCKKYGVQEEYIIIEITENIFIENKKATLHFLSELRKNNIKIAIDDFGTGYSSLSYLTFLPIDIIKFDKSLCEKFLELDDLSVIENLINLSHSFKLSVVAEGIEEYSQVEKLKRVKCDYIQGYYFSKPLDPEDVQNIYNKNFL